MEHECDSAFGFKVESYASGTDDEPINNSEQARRLAITQRGLWWQVLAKQNLRDTLLPWHAGLMGRSYLTDYWLTVCDTIQESGLKRNDITNFASYHRGAHRKG